ncbi:unnamed protein product [Arabis nemorensis]|uniref:J domain-containing protein n=1 Tax=Arabis nemorensis TaxID=586526 RepID=A0A565B0J2_9BRAS|nr:unnamed protein product [Arabis nemorensis]
MSKEIQEVLGYCEENFEKGNLELALRCAVSVSMSNPNAPEPYAHVTAYRILLTAANNRTATREPDYYAVLGIKRGSSSKTVAKSIERRRTEITELFNNGQIGDFKAVFGVCDLLKRGIAELKNDDRRRAYDLRSGFSLVD